MLKTDHSPISTNSVQEATFNNCSLFFFFKQILESVLFNPNEMVGKRIKNTLGIMGMSLTPHLGWKPIPRNPIPISSATALTY